MVRQHRHQTSGPPRSIHRAWLPRHQVDSGRRATEPAPRSRDLKRHRRITRRRRRNKTGRELALPSKPFRLHHQTITARHTINKFHRSHRTPRLVTRIHIVRIWVRIPPRIKIGAITNHGQSAPQLHTNIQHDTSQSHTSGCHPIRHRHHIREFSPRVRRYLDPVLLPGSRRRGTCPEIAPQTNWAGSLRNLHPHRHPHLWPSNRRPIPGAVTQPDTIYPSSARRLRGHRPLQHPLDPVRADLILNNF